MSNIVIEELEDMAEKKATEMKQCYNPGRSKFIRQTDGPKVYPMARHSFEKLVRESGAMIRYKGMVLIDCTIIDKYLENFREPAEI